MSAEELHTRPAGLVHASRWQCPAGHVTVTRVYPTGTVMFCQRDIGKGECCDTPMTMTVIETSPGVLTRR